MEKDNSENMRVIQWYPGHMAKAKRLIKENLQAVDLVVELLDARLPLSSRNPMLAQIINHKPRVLVLNKADLADAARLKQWIAYFNRQGLKAVPINSLDGKGIKQLVTAVREVLRAKMEKIVMKRGKARPMRLMILGIPNVGKSSLINKLAKQNSAKVGNKPGVTKGKQWIKIAHDMELLDTPGVLWPKFEDQEVGRKLAVTGAINDDVYPLDEVVMWLLDYLLKENPAILQERFKLAELPSLPYELFQQIGRRRGCLRSGGELDEMKVFQVILQEFRKGLLGKLILDCLEGE